MPPQGLGMLLDADDGDGQDLVRLVLGIALAVFLALLLAVALPLVLLGRAGPGAPAPERASVSHPELSAPVSDAVAVARRYLGVPYVFGGTNPQTGLDCSGLVQLVYRQLGVALPRTAQQQFDATLRVGRDDLQPGDLVFFARTYADPHAWVTHVGIYTGEGMHINAPTPGQSVSIQPVFGGFWGAHYAGAGRVRVSSASFHPGGLST